MNSSDCEISSISNKYVEELEESTQKSLWSILGIALFALSGACLLFVFLTIVERMGYEATIICFALCVTFFNGSVLCLLFWYLSEIRKNLKNLSKKN